MNWAAFCSYVLLTAITPGPNNIMSMSNAAKYGFEAFLPLQRWRAAGLFGGHGPVRCVLLAALRVHPLREALYALPGRGLHTPRLAWSIWRDKPHAEKKSIFTRTNTVVAGAVLQLVNVKVILYGITSLSSFVLPHYDSIPVLALFCCILSVTGFLCTLLWALFGAVFREVFQEVLQNRQRRHGPAAGLLRGDDGAGYLGLSARMKKQAAAAACFFIFIYSAG